MAAELAKAAPRRWWNRGTVVLGAAALLVGGFVGGVQAQKSYGTETPTASARPGGGAGGARGAGGYGNFGSMAGGSAPGGSAPGGSSASGGAATATTGKVKLVNGTTIYVETADGTVVTVRTGADTAVQTATAGKLKDVKAGDTVSVQGAADAEGTVTATTVTESKG